MLAHETDFESITACLFDEAGATLYRETLARLRG